MRMRRPIFLTVLVVLVLLAMWLALPRLIGFALSHWLQVPGLEQLSVRVDHLGWRQHRIASVEFRFRTESGDVIAGQLGNVTVRLASGRWQADRIDIDHASVQLTGAAGAAPSPWPVLQLPRLPFDRLHIEQLTLAWQATEQRGQTALRLTVQQDETRRLTLTAKQSAWQLDATLHDQNQDPDPNQDNALPARSTLQLQAQLTTQPGTPPLLDLTASIPAQLAAAPLHLVLHGDLRQWQHSPLSPALAGVRALDGRVQLEAAVQLAEHSGSWQQLLGNAQLTAITVDTELGRLDAAGALSFQATPDTATLQWQNSFHSEWTSTDPTHGQGQIALAAPFTLHWQTAGSSWRDGTLHSDGQLPLQWRSPQWGEWQIGADTLALTVTDREPITAQAELSVRGTVATLQQPALHAKQLRLAGKLAVELAETLTLSANTPFSVQAQQLDLHHDQSWRLPQPSLRWQGRLQLREQAGQWQLHQVNATLHGNLLRASQTAPANPDHPDHPDHPGSTELQLNQWRGQLQFADDEWQGELRAESGQWRQPDQHLQANRVLLRIPRFAPASGQGRAQFSADRIQHSALPDWPKPTLNLALQLTTDQLQFSGRLQQQTTELAQFTGQHRFTTATGSAALHWQHSLAALDRVLQPRPRALQPLANLRGHQRGELQLHWQLGGATGAVQATGTLQLQDGALQWDKATAEQLAVSAQLHALAPLQGELHLQLPQAELAAGIPVQATTLSVQLGADQLSVRELRSTLLGAIWHSEAHTLPRTPSAQALPITVSGLDLNQLLSLVDVDGLSGTGTLDGVLPFVYQTDGIAVRDGELHSRQPGLLKYAPATTVADNPGLQALRDFHYQHMRVTVNYQANGQYQIRLKLDGHNPDFYNGYPIAFTLNLNGELPGLFRAALLSGDFNQHVLQQLQSGQLQ